MPAILKDHKMTLIVTSTYFWYLVLKTEMDSKYYIAQTIVHASMPGDSTCVLLLVGVWLLVLPVGVLVFQPSSFIDLAV